MWSFPEDVASESNLQTTEIIIGAPMASSIKTASAILLKHKRVFSKQTGTISCSACTHTILFEDNARPVKELGKPRGPFMEAVDRAFTEHYDRLGVTEQTDGRSGWCSRGWYVEG
jgi:hypothetical protein